MARAGAVVAGLAFVGVTAAAFVWGPDLYDTLAADDPRGPEGCVVTVDGSGSYALSLDAADNAALIAGVGFQRGYGVNGITVALATAIQESGLRNLDYGDRDSLGLFQQRPSQGWGNGRADHRPVLRLQHVLRGARARGWVGVHARDRRGAGRAAFWLSRGV